MGGLLSELKTLTEMLENDLGKHIRFNVIVQDTQYKTYGISNASIEGGPTEA